MKRSREVRRLLLGGFAAGTLSAAVAAEVERITPESFFTNDTFVPGAGYYHAPFQRFYPRPYNHYDAARGQYFHGGQWAAEPHRSIVNISAPTPEAARLAQAQRTDLRSNALPYVVPRSGFGSTGGGNSIRS